MDITFEDGTQESMLTIFDMAVGSDGYVVMADTGECAPVYNDAGPIKPEDIGAFVKSPDTGECVLLRDNISDISQYAREKHKASTDEELVRFLSGGSE